MGSENQISADQERLNELNQTLVELIGSLKIDKMSLDDEWVSQPQLYQTACDSYARAISFRDQSKIALEQCDADVAKRIRASATAENKITENKVMELTLLDPIHIQYVNLHQNYKYMSDRFRGLVDSLAQRADALRDLVKLHSIKYYGTMMSNHTDFIEARNASIKAHERRNSEKQNNS